MFTGLIGSYLLIDWLFIYQGVYSIPFNKYNIHDILCLWPIDFVLYLIAGLVCNTLSARVIRDESVCKWIVVVFAN